jgi:AraC-like DNA-binding protein
MKVTPSGSILRKQRYYRVPARNHLKSIQPVFTDFHRLRMRMNHEYPRHQHTHHEAIFVEAGPYLCELNGTELEVSTNGVLLIKPGDWHQDHLRKGQSHFVIHFNLDRSGGLQIPPLFARSVRPEQQITCGHPKRDAKILEQIQAEAKTAKDHAAAVQDGLLSALFWGWIRGLPVNSLSQEWRALPVDEARREEILKLLQRHLRGHPTVPELARALRMSPRQFTTRCQNLLGSPPAKLLLALKLNEAEAMLRYQRRTVSEVSEALGFANPFHFSRVCRRVWGYPPRTLMG